VYVRHCTALRYVTQCDVVVSCLHLVHVYFVMCKVIRHQARVIFEQVVQCHLLATKEGTGFILSVYLLNVEYCAVKMWE